MMTDTNFTMNCKKARQLIDERVHDGGGLADPTREALDAHLASCPACAAEYASLLRTREWVGELACDAPRAEEKAKMWKAIESADPFGAGIEGAIDEGKQAAWSVVGRIPWGTVARFAAGSVGIAATLFVALLIGQERYEGHSVVFSHIDSRPSVLATERVAEQPSDGGRAGGYLDVSVGQSLGRTFSAGSFEATVDEEIDSALGDAVVSVSEYGNVSLGKDVSVEGRRRFRPAMVPKRDTVSLGVPLMSDVPVVGDMLVGEDAVADGSSGLSRVWNGADYDTVVAQDLWAKAKEEPTSSIGLASVGTDLTGIGDDSDVSKSRDERYGESYEMYGDGDKQAELGEETYTLYAQLSDDTNEGLALIGFDLEHNGVNLDGMLEDVEPVPDSWGDERPEMIAGLPGRTDGPAAPEGRAPAQGSPAPVKQARPKVIKTGTLTLEVEKHEEAVAKVEAVVGRAGAFIADAMTEEQRGGALTGVIVIRVAPELFEPLFAALRTVGRVEAENVKAADVTAEYVDIEARIQSGLITEERLHELIKSKSFMDDVKSLLEVERELARVRSEIEQYQGRLRMMADRIALSTITVTLREPVRTVPSATLSVEVPVLSEAATALGELLQMLGGRMLSGNTSKRGDGTLTGTYQLQVSLADFEALLPGVEALGRVEKRQVSDRQFGAASQEWASRVTCTLNLTLYERARSLPSGWVHLEVEDVGDAIAALASRVRAAGASIQSNVTTQEGRVTVANLTINVPAGSYAAFVRSVEPIGRLTGKNIAGEAGEIVGGAADVMCQMTLKLQERLREVPAGKMVVEVASFNTARALLSKMVREADVQVMASGSRQRTDGTWVGAFKLGVVAAKMEDLVTRLEGLGRVDSREIAGLGLGDLSKMDPDAIGVVGLTLAEKQRITPGREDSSDTIRTRVREGLTGLYNSVGLILHGLIVMAPWLVIVLLVGWLFSRRPRRRTKVRGGKDEGVKDE